MSFLGPSDLAHSSAVSRHWRQASELDMQLWRAHCKRVSAEPPEDYDYDRAAAWKERYAETIARYCKDCDLDPIYPPYISCGGCEEVLCAACGTDCKRCARRICEPCERQRVTCLSCSRAERGLRRGLEAIDGELQEAHVTQAEVNDYAADDWGEEPGAAEEEGEEEKKRT
jgi:hypothetical protein